MTLYWQHEASGVLAPVIGKYLGGSELSEDELATMRAYLRRWMLGPWAGAGVGELRRRVERLESTAELRAWFADAVYLGIDPL